MEKKKLPLIVGCILLVVSLVLAVNNTIKLSKSEWVCIAQECTEFVTDEDWVTQNCKLEENEMTCEFQYEGEYFRVPLSGVDIDKMISCREYQCSTKVLVSKSK